MNILGLFRLIGWKSGKDKELTAKEADLICEIAAEEPVSEEDHVRLRERVLKNI